MEEREHQRRHDLRRLEERVDRDVRELKRGPLVSLKSIHLYMYIIYL